MAQGTPRSTPPVRAWAPAAAAFLLTLGAALLERWQAADIVWSMWASSLVTGYAMILVAIVAGVRREGRPGDNRSVRPWPRRLAGGLFLLAFFSVHFLMFHYGHAVFTQHFFPLPALAPERGLPSLPAIVQAALAGYWPVVLASLVVRADGFRAAMAGDPRQALLMPYAFVVKNHLMIFIVAGLNALGLGAWLLYALFAWYFFPFGLLRGQAGSRPA